MRHCAPQVGFTLAVRDFLSALRATCRSPGFAIAAVVTMALGIGANTAISSVMDAVILRPLPFPHPERLFRIVDLMMALRQE